MYDRNSPSAIARGTITLQNKAMIQHIENFWLEFWLFFYNTHTWTVPKFNICTDHDGSKWILNLDDTIDKLGRCPFRFSAFEFYVIHSWKNQAADELS